MWVCMCVWVCVCVCVCVCVYMWREREREGAFPGWSYDERDDRSVELVPQ